jgi:D-3-phosphoglycerate dehydrogenase
MKVLVNKPIHPTALALLRAGADVLTPFEAPSADVADLLPMVDALLLCAGLSVGEREMDRSPDLRVIGRHGVGLDNVDLHAATQRGIPVVYTPYGPTESTAEHAFLLMMAAARQLPHLDRAVRAGRFGIRDTAEVTGLELHGKKLGVIGFGRIGRRVAEMGRAALDMQVHVYDPFLPATTITEWGAVPVQELEALAREVDVLTIHVPASDATHHLIDDHILQAMHGTAILVNASRGSVVDEAALVSALQAGTIYGAGIDVYDPEPPSPSNPLFQMDRVVLTPHVASKTEEGRVLMGKTVVQDILAVLDGRRPRYLANPEVWDIRRFAYGQT